MDTSENPNCNLLVENPVPHDEVMEDCEGNDNFQEGDQHWQETCEQGTWYEQAEWKINGLDDRVAWLENNMQWDLDFSPHDFVRDLKIRVKNERAKIHQDADAHTALLQEYVDKKVYEVKNIFEESLQETKNRAEAEITGYIHGFLHVLAEIEQKYAHVQITDISKAEITSQIKSALLFVCSYYLFFNIVL
jgi:hypothetical protein